MNKRLVNVYSSLRSIIAASVGVQLEKEGQINLIENSRQAYRLIFTMQFSYQTSVIRVLRDCDATL